MTEKIQEKTLKIEDFLGIGYTYLYNEEPFVLSTPSYLKDTVIENVEQGFYLPSLDPHLLLYDSNLNFTIKLWLILTYRKHALRNYSEILKKILFIANSTEKKVLVFDLEPAFFKIFFDNCNNHNENFETIFKTLLDYFHGKTILILLNNKDLYQVALNSAYKIKHENPKSDFIFKLY